MSSDRTYRPATMIYSDPMGKSSSHKSGIRLSSPTGQLRCTCGLWTDSPRLVKAEGILWELVFPGLEELRWGPKALTFQEWGRARA